MKKQIMCLSMLLTLFFCAGPSFAEDDVQVLKEQIRQLQQRVDELESRQNSHPSQGYHFNYPQDNRGWDPFEEMERMQRQMDQMFSHSFPGSRTFGSGPMMKPLTSGADFELVETDKSYEIRFDMSGLDQEKIDIEVNQHSVTIKGEHSRKDIEESDNRYFQAQSFGTFIKTIPLPTDADTEKMTTVKEDDSLVITLPKKVS